MNSEEGVTGGGGVSKCVASDWESVYVSVSRVKIDEDIIYNDTMLQKR